MNNLLKKYFNELIEQESNFQNFKHLDRLLRRLETARSTPSNLENDQLDGEQIVVEDDEEQAEEPEEMSHENDEHDDRLKRAFNRQQRKTKHFFIGKRR